MAQHLKVVSISSFAQLQSGTVANAFSLLVSQFSSMRLRNSPWSGSKTKKMTRGPEWGIVMGRLDEALQLAEPTSYTSYSAPKSLTPYQG